jgi:hypothetical protein
MRVRIPEQHKKEGVTYAVTDDGVELPVIDITHPAFAEQVGDEEIDRIIAGTVESMKRMLQLSAEQIQAMREASILMRVMMEASDTVMGAMATYLYKLGPSNLGDGYASALDRAIAAGITPLSMRLRLRHMAGLLADSLVAQLASRPGPLHLVNIAGGTAMDSLNALILLWNERRELMARAEGAGSSASRPAVVHVLDNDAAGPRFAARSLEALQAEGGPLCGLSASLLHVSYDWADVSTLERVLGPMAGPDTVVAVSSEGGLFEYPTDDQMIANLETLRRCTPPGCVVVGTIIRDTRTIDPRMAPMEAMKGRPTIRFIGVDRFREIASCGGWTVTAVCDEAIHHVVRLEKRAGN